MPLAKGSNKAVVSKNIKKLVHEWEDSGTIGNSHPKTKKKAVKQAVAIALTKAGKSNKQQTVQAYGKAKQRRWGDFA